jgi:hypothetical protein
MVRPKALIEPERCCRTREKNRQQFLAGGLGAFEGTGCEICGCMKCLGRVCRTCFIGGLCLTTLLASAALVGFGISNQNPPHKT